MPIITDEKVHLPIDLDDIKYNAACRDNSHSCTINKYLMDESLKSGDKAIIIYEASDSSGNKTEERLVLTIE